jgi:hypothetical protein
MKTATFWVIQARLNVAAASHNARRFGFFRRVHIAIAAASRQ